VTDPSGCVLLPWDTEFFGVSIARLTRPRLTVPELDEAMAFCARERVEILYLLAASDDPLTVRLAEDAGFRLVDVRVTLERRDAPVPEAPPDGPTIRAAAPSDVDELLRLAEVSHVDTRFFADQRLAPRAPALYARWLERALADAKGTVFVAEVDGRPGGYLACSVDAGGDGNIGLVAVSSAARRRGVGSSLVRAALAWTAARGAARTTVVTQARNVEAQALYQRAGFLTRSVELWLHKWF
jgi:dTDP-4-amino-4,6-dideoxy-D-galactose acyltransferase